MLLRWAAFLGVGAAALALVGLLRGRMRTGEGGLLVVSLALGLAVAAVPLYWMQAAGKVPRIHDISTDLQDPPEFVAVVPLRGEGSNPVEYAGGEVAEAQRLAYPDVRPLFLAM